MTANITFGLMVVGMFTAVEGAYRRSRHLIWFATGLFFAAACVGLA